MEETQPLLFDNDDNRERNNNTNSNSSSSNSKDGSNAIEIKSLYRGYGKSKVIENMNLTVKRGSIVGLLGPSGCGKTTLLRIILGRLIPDEGTVKVFGMEPHSKGSTVPGSDIGYSPQENALYDDITIEETFKFHSKLHGMSTEEYKERKEWLSKLLDLPPDNRVVGTLSGGQKRRVSLSVALLHSPKLLILDEPTVGVDCLTREAIWKHMREICATGVTIIVTTHYIEEARQADKVALMRNGKILEEGDPTNLINKYQCNTLEDVFLVLCRANEKEMMEAQSRANQISNQKGDIENGGISIADNSQNNNNNNNNDDESITSGKEEFYSIYNNIGTNSLNNSQGSIEPPVKAKPITIKRRIIQTLAIAQRKMTQIFRNKLVLSFEILSPTLQIFLFFIAIGATPKHLNFAVVNNDVGVPQYNLNLGNNYLSYFQQKDMFHYSYFNTTEQAIDAIKQGNAWGALIIPENFTTALPQRMQDPTNSYYVQQSNMDLYLDFTNYQITILIEQQVQLAFEALGNQFNISIDPVQIQPPVFGKLTTTFISYLAPGMISLIVFAHAIALSSVSFVREKIDGSLDRVFAIGVNTPTLLAGTFIAHISLLLIQTTLLLLLSVFGFNVPIEGNIVLVIIMIVLLGFVGMSVGLVISSVSKMETEAIQLSLASFFPALLLSGVMWCIQSIPPWASWLSWGLPTTWTAEALRDIMIRGSSFLFGQVWKASLVTIAWTICLFSLSAYLLKEKEYNNNWIQRLLKKKKKSN